jgi:hypothetical protein
MVMYVEFILHNNMYVAINGPVKAKNSFIHAAVQRERTVLESVAEVNCSLVNFMPILLFFIMALT